jgi:hypothetical protein
MPWLQRLPQFQSDALILDLAAEREAEFRLRLEPFRPQLETVAGRSSSTSRKSAQTKCGSMKRSCSVVPQRVSGLSAALATAGRSARGSAIAAPGSCAGSAASRSRGTRPVRAARSGRPAIQLVDADFGAVGVAGDVDQQVAQQPVDQPGQGRSPCPGAGSAQRDFQFVERVMPRLVDARRLAGRADEQAGKQVGQARMPLPVQDQAAQQIGPAQERAVERRRPPTTTWLPPPVPVWRPSIMNLSAPSRVCRASS